MESAVSLMIGQEWTLFSALMLALMAVAPGPKEERGIPSENPNSGVGRVVGVAECSL